MILLDANILLYAYDASSEHHSGAKSWIEELLSAVEPVALAWSTILAFIRIGTNPRAFARPLTIDAARAIVSSWLALPHVTILSPGERHWPILDRLLDASRARANLVTDAHLAALAIEHGVTLYSTDRDFSRFESAGLRRVDPLRARR